MPFIGDPHTDVSVSMHYDTEVSVIVVRGELRGAAVARLQPAIEAAVTAGAPVVVDLGEVSFLDAQGLLALLVLRQRLGGWCHAPAIVCRQGEAVETMFRVSGTDELFDLCATRQGALGRVRP